jgi:putative oxidoreductase
VLFAAHAGPRILVFTSWGTAQFFGSLGLPPTQVDTVGEVVSSVAVLTCRAAPSLIPILLGAIVLVHFRMAFLFRNPHGG